MDMCFALSQDWYASSLLRSVMHEYKGRFACIDCIVNDALLCA